MTRLVDLIREALAGLLQRPGRSILTALGCALGVGSLVAVLGYTTTVGGQIDERFNALAATEVRVDQADNYATGTDTVAFPDDTEQRVDQLKGVRSAGLIWPQSQTLTQTLRPGIPTRLLSYPSLSAASAGALRALRPTIGEGRIYDPILDQHAARVAVLGIGAAQTLDVPTVVNQPVIFIDDIAFTVVGIITDVARYPDALSSVFIPPTTAAELWGTSDTTDTTPSLMIDTQLGAARTIASQVALALRPDDPDAFKVTSPPDPAALRKAVTGDITQLILALAIVCLLVSAFGIANTSVVSVLERTSEIGLRRALGATRPAIAGQFLLESAALGTIGGLVGTAVAVGAVTGGAALLDWTAVLNPWTVLPAPLIGTLTGLVSGLYPAIRAARVQPVYALQR